MDDIIKELRLARRDVQQMTRDVKKLKYAIKQEKNND